MLGELIIAIMAIMLGAGITVGAANYWYIKQAGRRKTL
jgi:hypothetical protein